MTTDLLEKFNALKNQATPTPAVSAPPVPAVRGGNVKPNRYGGKCEKCTRWVEPGAGSFRKGDEGWIVFHVECPETVATGSAVAEATVTTADNPVKHGTYTVEIEGGHATFRISHQPDDARFAPGKDIIGVMLGSDNERYQSIGFVNHGHVNLFRKYLGTSEPWKVYLSELEADPEAVLDALNCRRCNRLLTTPESIATGIGPVCATLEG